MNTQRRPSTTMRVVFTLLAVATPAACGGGADSIEVNADSAAIVTLSARDIAVASSSVDGTGVTITGSLDPADQVEIKAQLSGQLESVLVERGVRVRRGSALARFESRVLRAQVASAQVQLVSAQRDLAAMRSLNSAGAVSERDLTQARVAAEAAQAQLAQAREALSQATVSSPITGVVSEKLVAAGEAVQPGQKLFTVVDASELELVGRVAAEQVGAIRTGQPASVTLDAYSGRVVRGAVSRIEPVADPGTRQVGVHIRVANPGHTLVAGLFATGRIETETEERIVLSIPATAVRSEGGQNVVYTVESGRIQQRTVTLGDRNDRTGLVTVRTGLPADVRVLVDPVNVKVGAQVRVADAGAHAQGGR